MSKSSTSVTTPAERRHDVRVQDAVGLQIQRITDLPAAGQTLPADPITPTIHNDKYELNGYATVRRDYPAVADYIHKLEEHIRQLTLDTPLSSRGPTHKVSLSAGGIHFAHEKLLHPGEMVQLRITLFPMGISICTDAEVLSCNDSPEVSKTDQLNYRAIFVRMSEHDKDLICQHVNRLLGRLLKLVD